MFKCRKCKGIADSIKKFPSGYNNYKCRKCGYVFSGKGKKKLVTTFAMIVSSKKKKEEFPINTHKGN